MNRPRHILAIDQGTTSTRSIVFDDQARAVSIARRELAAALPGRRLGGTRRRGHLARHARDGARGHRRAAAACADIAAVGITNQRETAVVWERSHRQADPPGHRLAGPPHGRDCARLKAATARRTWCAQRTGLLLDPYFSGTKIAWMLDEVPGARARAERGELAFGTIDCFLLWRLTGGRVHATDVTNASRTMLFDIHRGRTGTKSCCACCASRARCCREVKDSSAVYGETAAGAFDQAIPIAGIAGDQQAALIGQACFEPGMAKSTYGTGCFLLLNTGDDAVALENRMLTTPAYRIGGRTTYAMEGSIFVAGAAIKWLRDGLGIIRNAGGDRRAGGAGPDSHGVYMVPAFVGPRRAALGSRMRAALICGLTLDATGAHLARAALESVAYQTLDLTHAMAGDGAQRTAAIRVDGGMAANDWFCQFLADIARCARSSGRRNSKPRLSARHSWRVLRPESGRASRVRRRNLVARRAASRPRWRRSPARKTSPDGRRRFAGHLHADGSRKDASASTTCSSSAAESMAQALRATLRAAAFASCSSNRTASRITRRPRPPSWCTAACATSSICTCAWFASR